MHWPWWFPVVGALAVLSTYGCEENVTAVVGTDLSYSVYGVISPDLDTQWVRVFPIEPILEPARPDPLGAAVRSIKLASGERRTWRDTVLVGRGGMYAHLFYSVFVPQYAHAYRLEVVGERGDVASAEVRVPARTELVRLDPDDGNEHVRVEADDAELINTRARYHVRFAPTAAAELTFSVSYSGRHVQRDGGWELEIDLARDYLEMQSYLRATERWSPSFGLELIDMAVDLDVVDPAWRPPHDQLLFDPNVLVEPGVLDNVENGFGFVGAGYALRISWIPDDETLDAAGFRVPSSGTASDS